MNELIQNNNSHADIRWKLLTGASAFVLAAYVSSVSMAKAEDAAEPQVWVELGGQLSRLDTGHEAFSPPFEAMRPSIFSPSEISEKPPLYGFDMSGRVSFQPKNSDWNFSASVQYGRSSNNRRVHQQTYPRNGIFPSAFSTLQQSLAPNAARFADTKSRADEQHAIVDFAVGKDVGLGLFGRADSSFKLGVRFAQFESKSNVALQSDPDWHFAPKYFLSAKFHVQPYHSNTATLEAERSFHGIGPSLSWNSSTPLTGNSQESGLALDWGVNAAVLFGRQRARTVHETTQRYNDGGTGILHVGSLVTVYHHSPSASVRSRSVVVPNVGGFAGISWRYDAAKVSFGYRADYFFGAMDGGIDARKSETMGFHGPFATISLGLGG